MHRILLPLILTGVFAAPAVLAADSPDLTIYRSNDGSLFQTGRDSIDSGYAVIRERREVDYSKGAQDLTLGDLPDFLEPEAVAIRFDAGGLKVLSQRLLLAQHRNGALVGQTGKPISVLGNNGQVIVTGKLRHVDSDGSLIVDGGGNGPILVQRYDAVKLIGGRATGGSRLQVRLQADAGGRSLATLTYPAHGLGWRAAYTATLQSGDSCRMRLEALASIANRSGRDWNNADLKLVAGRPNTRQSTLGAPRMQASASLHSVASLLPAQGSLDAYRSYTLAGAVNLPANSVTLTPLYTPRAIGCERIWRYENGNAWLPPRPMTNASQNAATNETGIANVLRFQAPETLPEGQLRALRADQDGHLEFIGAATIADTPKHATLNPTLGTAFDLRAKRKRTAFNYDKNQHRIDEAFRISLDNSGDKPRSIDVIEHPNRWRQWTLVSSSVKPVQRSADTLEFRIMVPAEGSVKLDYAVRYQWTAADE